MSKFNLVDDVRLHISPDQSDVNIIDISYFTKLILSQADKIAI